MCGIVGYIGRKTAAPILLEGLRRLEYRGYDSAGIATHADGRLHLCKRRGKIAEGLARALASDPLPGTVGIGHTRWATHGPPSDTNAHPHLDASGRIAVVHNGVIENYAPLRSRLEQAGHQFRSETDTEVLAHLIGVEYERTPADSPDGRPRLLRAVEQALRQVIGTYGLVVLCQDEPGLLVGARRGSPLIVGLGREENFLASDCTAIVAHTRQVVYLNDHDLVCLGAEDFRVFNLEGGSSRVEISEVEFGAEEAELGGYAHYMLKEIHEQPQTIRNALRGRLDHAEATARFGGLNMTPAELRAVDRIVIAACGTSWHAGLVGEHLIEEFAHVPVEVEYASEFRYRNAPLDKNTLVLVITQSGETADTLAALREAKRRGHRVLAICNVVGSTIAREADGGIYLHAGPEIGVASTKAFTSQVTVLVLFALLMGRMRMMSPAHGLAILRELEALPEKIEQVLAQEPHIRAAAERFASCHHFFYIGRQWNFPVALEGALKLKEISYIHASGYPAAEMKHGPIALIEPATPTVVIAPRGGLQEKTLGNLEEIRARHGPIIAVGTEGDETLAERSDVFLPVPAEDGPLFPIVGIVPLQLLAYHIAVLRGCDVDKPRNLAKSVTVE
ncbi:MAG: glutamine--fructose-6-phosphate transaminase (isomerizing) [Verrucomicrobia bacterium]|nr:MAG: glutamine--fructose-6-phosphate transaminase (isomerizing) [Verrucomicrobiota bacterium]